MLPLGKHVVVFAHISWRLWVVVSVSSVLRGQIFFINESRGFEGFYLFQFDLAVCNRDNRADDGDVCIITSLRDRVRASVEAKKLYLTKRSVRWKSVDSTVRSKFEDDN